MVSPKFYTYEICLFPVKDDCSVLDPCPHPKQATEAFPPVSTFQELGTLEVQRKFLPDESGTCRLATRPSFPSFGRVTFRQLRAYLLPLCGRNAPWTKRHALVTGVFGAMQPPILNSNTIFQRTRCLIKPMRCLPKRIVAIKLQRCSVMLSTKEEQQIKKSLVTTYNHSQCSRKWRLFQGSTI